MTEKPIINGDIDKLLRGINNCGNQTDEFFISIMQHNIKVLSGELKNLYNALRKPEGWNEYQKKVNQLNDIYSTGKKVNGLLDYGENESEFYSEFTKLKKEYRDLISENRELIESFNNKVMKEPIAEKLDLRKIKRSKLPAGLTLSQQFGIDALIIEDIESESAKETI